MAASILLYLSDGERRGYSPAAPIFRSFRRHGFFVAPYQPLCNEEGIESEHLFTANSASAPVGPTWPALSARRTKIASRPTYALRFCARRLAVGHFFSTYPPRGSGGV